MQAAPEGLALETEMIPPTPATQDREDRGPHKERGDERRRGEERRREGRKGERRGGEEGDKENKEERDFTSV